MYEPSFIGEAVGLLMFLLVIFAIPFGSAAIGILLEKYFPSNGPHDVTARTYYHTLREQRRRDTNIIQEAQKFNAESWGTREATRTYSRQ